MTCQNNKIYKTPLSTELEEGEAVLVTIEEYAHVIYFPKQILTITLLGLSDVFIQASQHSETLNRDPLK